MGVQADEPGGQVFRPWRAHLERLAALALTVEDELKQEELVALLGEVYSAQNLVQTRLTGLLEAYKAECARLQH